MNILFQGDSITESGRPKPPMHSKEYMQPNVNLGYGYVNLIASRLLFEKPDFKIYNRGVSGNRICDMYSRWIEDALNIDFDVLSILCGINDVGFGLRLNMGADCEKFRFIYDRMLYEVKERNPDAKIVLMEPFLLKTDYCSPEYGNDIFRDWDIWSEEIKKRGSIVKELSEKYNAIFVPLYDDFQSLSEKFGPEHFSLDCIHPTPAGYEFIARKWMEACKSIL